MKSVLEKICDEKRTQIEYNRMKYPEEYLMEKISSHAHQRDFLNSLKVSLSSGSFALISEIKKASPSAGLIRKNFDASQLAIDYETGGATCLSVLTDFPFFQGTNAHLEEARKATSLPVLRKDFIIDKYQILESRAIGADCILLIMAALSDKVAFQLFNYTKELGMDVLVEIHSEEELRRATNLQPDLLGINNRDLKTLEVDINRTEQLSEIAPPNALLVSDSGLHTHSDLWRISASGVNCFLVGESLMRQKNVSIGVKNLLGPNTQNSKLG